MITETPIVKVKIYWSKPTRHKRQDRLAKWYCRKCQRWHYHGWPVDEVQVVDGLEVSGHRGSHCTHPNSPYQDTGYYMTEGRDSK